MELKYIIILIVVVFILCYTCYQFTFTQSTQKKIKKFEHKFVKNIDRKQKDLCGDKYKTSVVSDFYVCSSYNPFLTGFLRYDYSSLDMLQKSIIYGSRYIELEIFNKEIRNDTIPVVGSSSKDGSVVYGQNTIECQEVFNLISNIIFSERYLDNYQEPFFIFLNLKLKNNISTLDKLYDIIKSSLNLRLLDGNYSYQKQNIGRVKMCHLMEKVVIFSSGGYEHSKLEELINMSTNSPNLRRIKYNELPHTQELSHKKDIPNISIISKKIKLTQNIIYMLDETNFISLGIVPGMSVKIEGASNKVNNTLGNIIKIKQVTKNTLLLDSYTFKDESGENKISLKLFGSDYILKNIDKQNKSSLTIVYTEHEFFNFNFDPEGAWGLGCQFVCMNFQKLDHSLKKYMKKFKQFSILHKPSNLRFVEKKKEINNLNSLFPKYIENNETDIITDFSRNYFEVSLVPFKYSSNIGCCVNKSKSSGNIICSKYSGSSQKCSQRENCEFTKDIDRCKQDIVKVIYKNDFLSVSPSHKTTDSLFEIVPGLDNKFQSISIKYQNKYLVTNNSCCYISFKNYDTNDYGSVGSDTIASTMVSNTTLNNKPYSTGSPTTTVLEHTTTTSKRTEDVADNFRKHASFFAVKPMCSKDGFVSFMQIKDGKKYYIKYRKEFRYNERVYSTTTNEYDFVGEMNSKDGKIGIYQVKPRDNYKSIGNIFVKGDHKNEVKNRNTILLKGAVSEPVGFELVWNTNNIYIWRPVPGDGYVGLGVVVTLTKEPPNKHTFCCVAIEYTSEVPIDDTMYWSSDGNDPSNPLSIWEVPSKNYYISNVAFTKPSEFGQPVYSINLEASDYMDRLFMGKETAETESLCFKVIKNKTKLPDNIEPVDFDEYIEDNNYKISFYDKTEDNPIKKCIGLEYVYWSKYYRNNRKENKEQELNTGDCKTDDYMGTNFIFNQDGTIRLKENTSYCLKKNSVNKLVIGLCNGEKSQEFFYDRSKNTITSLENSFCLDNSLNFNNECVENSNFFIKQGILTNCIDINSIVYIKKKIKRYQDSYFSQRKDNTVLLNLLTEEIDRTYLHVYIKGIVTDKKNDKYKIKLYDQNSSIVYVDKDSNSVIPYFIPQGNKIDKGAEILVENGGVMGKYSEKNIRWKAKVIEKLENNKYVVLFSINSIEADLNKMSFGRPRTNEKKIIDIMDMVILRPALECN